MKRYSSLLSIQTTSIFSIIIQPTNMIGASLSEPHINSTALREIYVYIYIYIIPSHMCILI